MKILWKVTFVGASTTLLALSYTDKALTYPVVIQPAPGIPSEPYLHYGEECTDELDVDSTSAVDSQQAIERFAEGFALDGPDGNDPSNITWLANSLRRLRTSEIPHAEETGSRTG